MLHLARPAGGRLSKSGRRLLLSVLVLAVALLMVPAIAAAAPSSTGDGGWFWQNPLPQGNDLSCVAFSDAAHGWAVGADGTILATSNGGATWSGQSSGTTSDLYGVAFSDASHGRAVGQRGTILEKSPPARLLRIHFCPRM